MLLTELLFNVMMYYATFEAAYHAFKQYSKKSLNVNEKITIK